MQVPERHAYAWLQRLFPVHAVPSDAFGREQMPLAGSHTPARWHGSEALHVTGFDPMHVPIWHVSLWVHALPSLHVVPLDAMGFEHVPVLGSHAPATWHWSLAAHETGLDPVHAPLTQAYAWLHLLEPVHAVPSGAAGFEHVPEAGSQLPAE